MSLLRHLMDGWHPEGAATRALAHILDRRTCPGMADAFVKLIAPAGVPAFPADSVEHEASRSDDSRPDITIRDADGKLRVLVATTFWNGVHDSQPVSCLPELPEDAPSALVFIAPRERIRGLWSELRTRCQDSPGLGLRDESSRTGDPVWARAGRHVLMIASWRYVLDALRCQAEDPAVEQDIDELLGLVDQTDRRAFTPLEPGEVADVNLARRLFGYRELVDKIAARLEESGVAKPKPGTGISARAWTGWLRYRSMKVGDKFDVRLGIQLKAWRDLGITPLWCVLRGVKGNWQRIKAGLDDARSYRGRLHIPIRLPSDADEARTIDDAVDQMRHVAHKLATARHGVPSRGPSRSPARQSLLGQAIPSKRRETATTLALQHVLETAPDIASAFVERLMGGGFETGRVVSEWKFGPVRPDLTVFDAPGEVRLFIENKFGAKLTERQPIDYLRQLPEDGGQSMLAFIAPENRAESLWTDLKKECQNKGYALVDESSTKHFRRMRVAKLPRDTSPTGTPATRWKWVLLTSWRWVLDTLQQAAAAEGYDAIERDIVQLRGLTERTASTAPRSGGHDDRADVSPDARLGERPDAAEQPSGASPVTDWRVARRMSNYTGLIDEITKRLVKKKVADTRDLAGSGWRRYLRVRRQLVLRLEVDLRRWRDQGITPVWCSFSRSRHESLVQRAKSRCSEAHAGPRRLYIPIGLQTGVVRNCVIEDACRQILGIADTLLEEFPE